VRSLRDDNAIAFKNMQELFQLSSEMFDGSSAGVFQVL
jgi:hypothetical protein